MSDGFHFLQPLWLLGILPLAWLLWRVRKGAAKTSPWHRVLDPRLQPLLLGGQGRTSASLALWLLAAGWLLSLLALANPTWERQPSPLMLTGSSRVVVLDLSRSMLAADLRPSRLVRARFKVEDLLDLAGEGQTGLVVFAGDAFTVSPLTRDADTIRAQLRVLEPAIMPVQGSRAGRGLLQALELLKQAGVPRGQVILIADGAEPVPAIEAAGRLRDAGHRVSVLGVGTPEGAPLPDGRGGFSRAADGRPLLVPLEETTLEDIAEAGGGRYVRLTADTRDVRYLLAGVEHADTYEAGDEGQLLRWQEKGPWLVLLLLPLAALAFRRGWLLVLPLGVVLVVPVEPAIAVSWEDAWLRPDQQATRALERGDYAGARRLAEDPMRRGVAAYREGDFDAALDAFNTAGGADAAYNRGNALARLGRYEEAIGAYDEALQVRPDMPDAEFNKAAIEALLRQRQEDRPEQPEEPDAQDEADEEPSQASEEQAGDESTAQPSESADAQEPGDGADDGGQPQQADRTDGEGGESAETSEGADSTGEATGQTEQQPGDLAGEADSAGGSSPGKEEGGEQSVGAGRRAGEADTASAGNAGDDSAAMAGGQQGPEVDTAMGPEVPVDEVGEGIEPKDRDRTAESGPEPRDGEAGRHASPEPNDATEQRAAGMPSRDQDREGPGDSFAEANRRLQERLKDGQGPNEEPGPSAEVQPSVDGQGPPSGEQPRPAPDRPEPLSTEEQLAAQQWLRRIPDDPGGLLRRKFLYQYRQRAGQAGDRGTQDW